MVRFLTFVHKDLFPDDREQSVSESVSDKGTYRAVWGQLKIYFRNRGNQSFFQQASPSPMTPEHLVVVVGAVVVVVVGKIRPKSPARSPG